MNLLTNDFADTARVIRTMRDELTLIGVKELRTPEEVDQVLSEKSGTAMIVFNSVCGCAAGNARPGVGLALQNDVIPDRIYSVFAGQDRAATDRVRQHLAEQPPSSPSIALFKDGRLAYMMHRHLIEGRDAVQVARDLIAIFNEHCTTQGPSVSPDIFAQMPYARMCGSKIPSA
jgi:putative YphP/YqiW family bacilliredoxin